MLQVPANFPSGSTGTGTGELVVSELVTNPDFVLNGQMGTDYWIAKARYGDNLATGEYELELGYGIDNPTERVTDNLVWTPGQVYPFSLSFFGNGESALTIGAKVMRYDVQSSTSRVALTIKCPDGGTIDVTNLVFNGEIDNFLN